MSSTNKGITVGIVGCGFVGSSVAKSFTECGTPVLICDPQHAETVGSLKDLYECEAIFVCVPTPPTASGACDTAVLSSILDTLVLEYSGLIISKCTATPAFYKSYSEKIAHMPEFLTQANAYSDYINALRHVVGCSSKEQFAKIVAVMGSSYRTFPADYVHCSVLEASLLKYTANCFLATKVALLNEIYDYAQVFGINWNTMSNLIMDDSRLGYTHTQVPGPDGKRGFGGACFPKDCAALVNSMDKEGAPSLILQSVLTSNARIRGGNTTPVSKS